MAGFVIRELSPVVSNWRADFSLAEYLEKNGIPGIQGIDTRALTKKLRVRGALNGFISTEEISEAEAVARAKELAGFGGVDYVKEVTHKKAFRWDEKDEQSASFNLARGPQKRRRAQRAQAAAAGGHSDRRVRLRDEIQHSAPAAAAWISRRRCCRRPPPPPRRCKHKPAGIFLSNGPGDPAALDYIVREVNDLVDSGIPIFGICLGHQILGQAFGGKTFKLKFGHRGGNQPVKDLGSGKVEITSQNHGFAVDPKSLPADVSRGPDQFERPDRRRDAAQDASRFSACNIIPKRRPARTIRRRCSPNSAR